MKIYKERLESGEFAPPPATTTVAAATTTSTVSKRVTVTRGSHGSVRATATKSTANVPTSDEEDDDDPTDEEVMEHRCIRVGCHRRAVRNAEWEDEYCSDECVVRHCKDVFATWVKAS